MGVRLVGLLCLGAVPGGGRLRICLTVGWFGCLCIRFVVKVLMNFLVFLHGDCDHATHRNTFLIASFRCWSVVCAGRSLCMSPCVMLCPWCAGFGGVCLCGSCWQRMNCTCSLLESSDVSSNGDVYIWICWGWLFVFRRFWDSSFGSLGVVGAFRFCWIACVHGFLTLCVLVGVFGGFFAVCLMSWGIVCLSLAVCGGLACKMAHLSLKARWFMSVCTMHVLHGFGSPAGCLASHAEQFVDLWLHFLWVLRALHLF